MTILSIRTVGDPVLRSVCEPITVFDDDLARLIDDMLETMCLRLAKKTRKAAKAACPCPARSPQPRAKTGRA